MKLLLLVTVVVLAEAAPLSELLRNVRSRNGFEEGRSVGVVAATNEASGLGASRQHPGVLYTLNDSGDKNRIFAISANSGRTLATLDISGAKNQDWEDLAVGPCGDGGYCIYIGDVGGNSGYVSNRVYKVREPSSIRSQTLHVSSFFKFSWSQKDCESVMVDNTGQVYLISKVTPGNKPKLYALPRTTGWGSNTRQNIASVARLSITSGSNNPVAADISPNGQEILVKAYGHVYYWKRSSGESIKDALQRRPADNPIRHERQGETVAWSSTGDGYYTLSEGNNQNLYFFKRQ